MFKQYLSPTSVAYFETTENNSTVNDDGDNDIGSLSTKCTKTKTNNEDTTDSKRLPTTDADAVDDDYDVDVSKQRPVARRTSSSFADLPTKITAALLVTSDQIDDECEISTSCDNDRTFSTSNEIHFRRQSLSSLPDVLSSMSMCTNTIITSTTTSTLPNHASSSIRTNYTHETALTLSGATINDDDDDSIQVKAVQDKNDNLVNQNERLQYHHALLKKSHSVSTISTRSLSSAASSLSTSSRALPSSNESPILSLTKSSSPASSVSMNPTLISATSSSTTLETHTVSSAMHNHHHHQPYIQNHDTLSHASTRASMKKGTIEVPSEGPLDSSNYTKRRKNITMKIHFNETVIVHTYKLQVQYYKETAKASLYYNNYEYEQMEINAYRDLVQYQSSKRNKKQQQQQTNTTSKSSSSIASSATTTIYCYRGLESFYGTKNYKLCKLRRKGLMDEILQEQYHQYSTSWVSYDEMAFYNCSIAITKYDQMIAYQRGLDDEYNANKIYGRYSSLPPKKVICSSTTNHDSEIGSNPKQPSQSQQSEQSQTTSRNPTQTNSISSILPLSFRTKQKKSKDNNNNSGTREQQQSQRRNDAPTYWNRSLSLSSRRSRRISTTTSEDPDGSSLADLVSCVSAPTSLFRSSHRSSTSSTNASRGPSSTTATTISSTTTRKEKKQRRFWPKSFSLRSFRTNVRDIPSSQISVPDHETI